jgi:MFS family permease
MPEDTVAITTPNRSRSYKRRLEMNIKKYSWFKIFTKRVYLPLIAIQLVAEGNVTVGQLAVIASAAAITQLILQVPTGYFADKFGNKAAIILGAAITAVSPLFYIFLPNFWGGLLAAELFFGGYAFQSGAIEAFMHDTLVALGREKEYARVMGRAQSYGLTGNVVLITLVPLTYAIDPNIPFLLGFVSLLLMLWLSLSFTYPRPHEEEEVHINPFLAAKNIVTPRNVAVFIFAGAMAGVANRGAEYRELLFQDLGIAVFSFGVLLALGSIAGAIMGRFIHLLDDLKPQTFYFTDLLIISLCLVAVGISRNPLVAVIGFTLFAGYGRVRSIIIQSKLLKDLKYSYKATLLSTLNLFSDMGDVAAISLLALFIVSKDYTRGYLFFGITVFVIAAVLWLIMYLVSRQHTTTTAK